MGNVDRIDSRRIRHGDGLLSQALHPLCLPRHIDGRRPLGHVGAARPQNDDGAGLLQVRISVPDRVQIDFQGDGDLPHGRHLLTRTQRSGPDRLEHLVADLHVNRHAVVLKMKRWNHTRSVCMIVCIQSTTGSLLSRAIGQPP